MLILAITFSHIVFKERPWEHRELCRWLRATPVVKFHACNFIFKLELELELELELGLGHGLRLELVGVGAGAGWGGGAGAGAGLGVRAGDWSGGGGWGALAGFGGTGRAPRVGLFETPFFQGNVSSFSPLCPSMPARYLGKVSWYVPPNESAYRQEGRACLFACFYF